MFGLLYSIKNTLPQHFESRSVKVSRNKLHKVLTNYYTKKILPDILKADPELDEVLLKIKFSKVLDTLIHTGTDDSGGYRNLLSQWLEDPRSYRFEWKFREKLVLKFDFDMYRFFKNQGYEFEDMIPGMKASKRTDQKHLVISPNKEFFQKLLYGIVKASDLMGKPLQIVSIVTDASNYHYGDSKQLSYTENNDDKIVFHGMRSGFYFDSTAINKIIDGFSESGFYIGNYKESEIIPRLMSCFAAGSIIVLSTADETNKNSFVIAFNQDQVFRNFHNNEIKD